MIRLLYNQEMDHILQNINENVKISLDFSWILSRIIDCKIKMDS